jgi:hypothetical protein
MLRASSVGDERQGRESDSLAVLRSARRHEQVGEIVRILVRADKAAFAKIYAAVKAEEAAMDADMDDFIENFRGRSKEKDKNTEEKPDAGGPHTPASGEE